jgi:predicted Zn-dependent peptidase
MKTKVNSSIDASDFNDSNSFLNACVDNAYSCLDDLDDYIDEIKANTEGDLNKLARNLDKKARYTRSALDDVYYYLL